DERRLQGPENWDDPDVRVHGGEDPDLSRLRSNGPIPLWNLRVYRRRKIEPPLKRATKIADTSTGGQGDRIRHFQRVSLPPHGPLRRGQDLIKDYSRKPCYQRRAVLCECRQATGV